MTSANTAVSIVGSVVVVVVAAIVVLVEDVVVVAIVVAGSLVETPLAVVAALLSLAEHADAAASRAATREIRTTERPLRLGA